MKKFAFTLERILGFKQTLYEKERNMLAQLRNERLMLETRRDDTLNQFLRMDASFREKAANGGVRIDEVTSLSFHRDNADRLVKQLDEEIAAKDVEIEAQLKIVIELDKEVKSLEKLREKQWEEYVADTMREENERIMEMVSGRYVDNQREIVEAEQKQQNGNGN